MSQGSRCSLTGDRSPEVLARADDLFQGVLYKIQRQIYDVYGALELMVWPVHQSKLKVDCRSHATIPTDERTIRIRVDAVGKCRQV